MARVLGHRALDFEQPLYVRAPALQWNEHRYKRGELFPWSELKVLPRKVHQLWMQRKLGHERLGDAPQGAEAPHPTIKLPLPVTATTVEAPLDFVSGGSFDVPPSVDDSQTAPVPSTFDLSTVDRTKSETVSVETPAQARARHRRR